jgi:hypothetical protein
MPAPKPRPFAPGEQIDLVIDFLRVRSGTLRLAIGQPRGAIWPVTCQARSGGWASLLDIRERYVTSWDAKRGASRGNDLDACELGDRHTASTRFDREGGKATVKVVRKGRTTERTHDVPRDVQDPASALLFLRLQPLTPGARYACPVFSGAHTFLLEAVVEGAEPVETPAGRFDAVRVGVKLAFRARFKTRRAAHLWFSADARRIPVRATADFAVGSVDVRLAAFHPGGEPASAS